MIYALVGERKTNLTVLFDIITVICGWHLVLKCYVTYYSGLGNEFLM